MNLREPLKLKIENLLYQLTDKEIDETQFEEISDLLHKLENYINISTIEKNENFETKILIEAKQRNLGLEKIRNFTKDAEKLIIIDPYFFAGSSSDVNIWLEEVKKASRLQKLKCLNIIYDKSNENKIYITKIKQIANNFNCKLTTSPASYIHDRVWIKNRENAILVGGSFGGIGKIRLSFILDLPNDDLKILLNFLDNNKLL